MVRLLSAFALALSLLGCDDSAKTENGDDSEAPVGGSSGAAGAGGSSGAAGAMGGSTAAGAAGSAGAGGSGGGLLECNRVPTNAPEYPVLYDGGLAPAGKGGTIVDGTYLATSETWYETPSGASVNMDGVRLEISGSQWQEAHALDFDVHVYRRFNHEVSTSGASLTIAQSCPGGLEPETFEFTAENDTLIVYVGDESSKTFGITFTRQ